MGLRSATTTSQLSSAVVAPGAATTTARAVHADCGVAGWPRLFTNAATKNAYRRLYCAPMTRWRCFGICGALVALSWWILTEMARARPYYGLTSRRLYSTMWLNCCFGLGISITHALKLVVTTPWRLTFMVKRRSKNEPRLCA